MHDKFDSKVCICKKFFFCATTIKKEFIKFDNGLKLGICLLIDSLKEFSSKACKSLLKLNCFKQSWLNETRSFQTTNILINFKWLKTYLIMTLQLSWSGQWFCKISIKVLVRGRVCLGQGFSTSVPRRTSVPPNFSRCAAKSLNVKESMHK